MHNTCRVITKIIKAVYLRFDFAANKAVILKCYQSNVVNYDQCASFNAADVLITP